MTPCFCFCFLVVAVFFSCRHGASCLRLGNDGKSKEDNLKPGIHAIMSLNEELHPTTTAMNDGTQVLVRVALFYWPIDRAFDTDKINRSNISCLYLRTLHEICDSVMIESSMDEV